MYWGVPKNRAAASARCPKASSPKAPVPGGTSASSRPSPRLLLRRSLVRVTTTRVVATMLRLVTAALTKQRLLVATSLTLCAVVFVADAVWERPGLGIGHFFDLAIALLALAGGVRLGAAAGAAAAVLYALATVIDPHVASGEVLTIGMVIRATTFISIGMLIGLYASGYRGLVDELQVLVQRDQLTGLPNTRAFEAAITRRLESGRAFALLLGDMDALMAI